MLPFTQVDGSTLDWIGNKIFKVAKYPPGQRKSVKPLKSKKHSAQENPSSFLLRLLLSASPYYVSGSILAQRLKMSRVGVWSRIAKLREAGLSIEASQNRGYRLAAEPDKFNQSLLEAWIHEEKTKCKIFVQNSIDSTNSEAEKLLANGEKGPFAVIANEQKKGRGRLGRSWYSPQSGNIHLSMAFRPDVNLIQLRSFTLWQGICIAQLLRTHTGNENISLKWPNDLVINGKKLGGMLTEASIDCERVRSMIFGIGLNVNSLSARYPKSISNSASSLHDLAGRTFRVHEITAKIIKVVLAAYKQCTQGLPETELEAKWENMDALLEKKVEIKIGKETLTGKAVGIDTNGALKVKAKNGRIRLIHSGEVTVKKW